MVTVLSVGGSIVAPQNPDIPFLKEFVACIRAYLKEDVSHKVILVVGGGGPARTYQNAYRSITEAQENEADWIGIAATRLNAQLLKAIFAHECPNQVVYDPTENVAFSGQILIAAGWKPGFSTDNDAVLLAERFGSDTVVNLSNIAQVYTDDPKKDPDAKPLETVSWDDFLAITGTEWIPGKNSPFDPIASQRAKKAGITVICADGHDINNLQNILHNKSFVGTKIGSV